MNHAKHPPSDYPSPLAPNSAALKWSSAADAPPGGTSAHRCPAWDAWEAWVAWGDSGTWGAWGA